MRGKKILNDSKQYTRRGRRSRFSALEKKSIVEETYEKGSCKVLCERIEMKCQFIQEKREEHPINILCKVLEISRSGFYAWLSRPMSKGDESNQQLLTKIRESHERSRETYGYRRIVYDLRSDTKILGKNRVFRLMQVHGIKAKTKRKFKITTDSRHSKPIYENKLNREFSANKPNQRWVSDITYIPTMEGWLYLSVIMDLFSRKIIGWSMDSRMKEDITLNALKMALFKRRISCGVLLHSDRGSQYAASEYQGLLKNIGIECSMSRKGNCWDNAGMESFFHTLKVECTYHENFKTREEAKKVIFEYIEFFYNKKRRYSTLNYNTPAKYELMQAFLRLVSTKSGADQLLI